MSADELAVQVDRLVSQVSQWTPSRWAASTASGPGSGSGRGGASGAVNGPTRAELVHGLVQEVADLAATAEGQPRRPVPRLEHDAALPDQLRVVAADLIAASAAPEVLAVAATRVRAVRLLISPSGHQTP
jgi:hypothetical protein